MRVLSYYIGVMLELIFGIERMAPISASDHFPQDAKQPLRF